MRSHTSVRSDRNVMSGKPKKSLEVATGISLSENKEIASGNWDRSSQPGRHGFGSQTLGQFHIFCLSVGKTALLFVASSACLCLQGFNLIVVMEIRRENPFLLSEQYPKFLRHLAKEGLERQARQVQPRPNECTSTMYY